MRNQISVAGASKLTGLIAGLMAITLSVAGCSSEHGEADSPSSENETGIAEITTDAVEFGGIVIPVGVTVLAADTDRGLDTRYRLTLSADPQGLTEFLSASGFSAPLTAGGLILVSPVAGPPLETSPSVVETSDRIQRPSGKHVSRSVTVDERDATTRYVHVQLFTT